MDVNVKDGKIAATGDPNANVAGVVKGLEPFIDADGKVDTTKLGQSYLELRKGFTDVSQKLSTLDQAYKTLAGKIESAVKSDVKPIYEPDKDVNRLLSDPREYVVETASNGMAGVASEIRMGLLELTHPEIKDLEFVKGLQEFSKTMPPAIMDQIENYQVADWVVRQYKARLAEGDGKSETERTGLPRVERPSGGPKPGAKRYTRAEIRELMKRPAEYAKVADDISLAYDEGRVDG